MRRLEKKSVESGVIAVESCCICQKSVWQQGRPLETYTTEKSVLNILGRSELD